MKKSKQKASGLIRKKISLCRLLILDFDGVLTDNKVYQDELGKETVKCDRRDGLGLEMLKAKKNMEIVIISKEKNRVVSARAKKLKLACIQGIDDKLSITKRYLKEKNLSFNQTCFVGNDINDLECLKHVGLSVGVKDSHPNVLEIVDYVTSTDGGNGAVREVCELFLKI